MYDLTLVKQLVTNIEQFDRIDKKELIILFTELILLAEDLDKRVGPDTDWDKNND